MKKKQHVQWRTPLDIPAMDKQEVFTPKFSVYLYTKYTKYSVYSVYPNQLNLPTKYCFIPKRKYIQGHKQHLYTERKWKWKSLGCVQLFVTPWTIQSMDFSSLEYWSG